MLFISVITSLDSVVTMFFFFFNDTATTEIYTYRHTLSLHDALPIWIYCEYQRGDHGRPVRSTDSAHRRPSLLVGPWDRVETVLRLLESSADAEFRPVGILDDSGSHIRMKLRGVPILGSTDALEEVVKQMRSEEHTSELQSLMRNSY